MNDQRRGQLHLSFGMIFSIIIIIATLAIAGYILVRFLDFGTTISCKIFFKNVQDEIDKAWAADLTSKVIAFPVPKEVLGACFGNSTQSPLKSKDQERFDDLQAFQGDSNVYLYPSGKGCSFSDGHFTLKHAQTPGFFCVAQQNSKIQFRLTKEFHDASVRLGNI